MVIAAAAFLRAPEAHLRAICARLEIDFSPRMLRWPLGPRAKLDQAAQRVAEQARPHYERLLQHALLA